MNKIIGEDKNAISKRDVINHRGVANVTRCKSDRNDTSGVTMFFHISPPVNPSQNLVQTIIRHC